MLCRIAHQKGLNNNASSFFFTSDAIRKCIFFSIFFSSSSSYFFLARWKLSVKTIRRVLFINTCIVFLLICTDIMDFLTFNRSGLLKNGIWKACNVMKWRIFFFCSFYGSEDNNKKIDSTSKRHKSDGNCFSIECLSLHISASLLIHTNTRCTIVNRPHNDKRFDERVENKHTNSNGLQTLVPIFMSNSTNSPSPEKRIWTPKPKPKPKTKTTRSMRKREKIYINPMLNACFIIIQNIFVVVSFLISIF